MVSDAWLQEREADVKRLQERAGAIRALLAKTPISSDVKLEYPELVWADEAIGRHGLYADLTIIGPATLGSGDLKWKVIEGMLFSSGRPILVVPEGFPPDIRPKRIVLAWDGRVEAARAVREAVEMLSNADDVSIVLVDPVEGERGHGQEPGADIATYLARHGARVNVERLPRQGLDVEDILRRYATDWGADLMVMGAYGHSRVRERIFGGVTLSFLETPCSAFHGTLTRGRDIGAASARGDQRHRGRSLDAGGASAQNRLVGLPVSFDRRQ